MINSLSIRNKKIIIILVAGAVIIPFIIFLLASFTTDTSQEDNKTVPTKEPLPTFPDTQAVEDELIIRYVQGQEFDSLTEERKNEISQLFESYGVISQEKAYPEATEGDLTRSYLLKFSGGQDIEAAAQEIYKLPEIEGAQPNTQFGLF